MDIDKQISELKINKKTCENEYEELNKKYKTLDKEEAVYIKTVTDTGIKLYEGFREIYKRYGLNFEDAVLRHYDKITTQVSARGVKQRETQTKEQRIKLIELVIYRSKQFVKYQTKVVKGEKLKNWNAQETKVCQEMCKEESTPEKDTVVVFLKSVLKDLTQYLTDNEINDSEMQISGIIDSIRKQEAIVKELNALAELLNSKNDDIEKLERKIEYLTKNRWKYIKKDILNEKIAQTTETYRAELVNFITVFKITAETIRNQLVASCREKLEKNREEIRDIENAISEIDNKLSKFDILDDISEIFNHLNDSQRMRELFNIKIRLINNSTDNIGMLYNALCKYSGGDQLRLIEGLKRLGIRKNIDGIDEFMKRLENLASDNSFIEENKRLIATKDELFIKWQKAQERPELLESFIQHHSETLT